MICRSRSFDRLIPTGWIRSCVARTARCGARTGRARDCAWWPLRALRRAGGTLKYRGPASAHGFARQGRARCPRGAGVKDSACGRVVRIALKDHDRHIFTPAPWGSLSWRREYKRRTALERINSRLDSSFGFEHHFIRGAAEMKARMGLAVTVMMALTLGAALEGRPQWIRSLINPPFDAPGFRLPPPGNIHPCKAAGRRRARFARPPP